MTSPPDHLQMVSLRGEEYVFELKGMMPDGLIERPRQLYMDSFLIFVLPVDVETIGNFRAHFVREVLNALTGARLHKVPSNVLNMMIDKRVWMSMFEKYLPKGQVTPAFPWPIPRADPAAPSSPMLQAWRRKMGLSCEDETPKDTSSTDSMLSNIVRLSTQEKVQEFLEEQQLTQWYTTRAALPKKPVKEGSRVSRQERSASRGRARSRRSRSPSRHEFRRHRSRSPRRHENQRRRVTPSRRREEPALSRSERQERSSPPPHTATSTTLLGGQKPNPRPTRVNYFGPNSQTTSNDTYKLCAIDNSLGGGPRSNIYTTSRDVATGQALYNMVKDDPKLRDVNIMIIGRDLQGESRSGEFHMRIMPVPGRINTFDGKKLLCDPRAVGEAKSHEVFREAPRDKPDLSKRRNNFERFDIEVCESEDDAGQDVNMTGSMAGHISVTEAQSNAAAPSTLMSSTLSDLDDSAATSQPVSTAPATITPSNNEGGSKRAAHMESINLPSDGK